MIPTPNGRDESGTSRDCYLFNPTWISQSQLTMFRFLGILMGIGKYCEKNQYLMFIKAFHLNFVSFLAIRSGSPLSLNLAEPMWKLIAGSSLTVCLFPKIHST